MTLNEIIALDEKYYMNCFGRRNEVCFTHGEGVTLYDTEGKAYTDFLAGIAVNCLGYGDKGLSDTIANQASKLIHCSTLKARQKQLRFSAALQVTTRFFSQTAAQRPSKAQ